MRLLALLALAVAAVAMTAAPVAPAQEEGEVTVCVDGTDEFTFVPDEIDLAIIDNGGFWTEGEFIYLDPDDYGGDPEDLFFVTVTLGPCAQPAPAATPPPTPPALFLCYSSPWQQTPGVWPYETGLQLMHDGYWQPMAVAGSLPGGVNTTDGKYHLECNADDRGLKPTETYVDNNGYVIPGAYANAYKGLPGVYQVFA